MKLFKLVVLAAAALLAGCATSPVSTPAEMIDFTRYHAIYVPPVQFAPEVTGQLPAEERVLLEHDLGDALNEGLPKSWKTDQPSAGVVRIEVTITELNASSPAVNLLTTALLFVPFDAGGVAFDARFYDGTSREPFAQSSYRHTSTPLELKGSFKRYGHATKSLRDWAEGLTSSLVDTSRQKVARND